MALVEVLKQKKARAASQQRRVRDGAVSTWQNGMPVEVVEGDGRVCDGDARRGWVDEKLVASDDGSGGLAG
jgi:SH3-like domain-containing protein